MTSNHSQPAPKRPANKVAATMFLLAAACFFVVAAISTKLAPWFAVIGGLNLVNGVIQLMHVRKAAAASEPASGGAWRTSAPRNLQRIPRRGDPA